MGSDVTLAILQGVPVTLGLTVAALGVGALGGIPLVMARVSHRRALRLAARAATEVLRGVPPLVWLFIIYFGLGTSLPGLDPMSASIIGLGLISCAYMAEIYRGGLAGVNRGQWEAASALGMMRTDTSARIIAPQVVRISVPATATYAIGLLKDSSVAFTLGTTDILYWANDQSRLTSDAIGPFIIAAVVYIVMSVPCAWGARTLDATLRRRVAR